MVKFNKPDLLLQFPFWIYNDKAKSFFVKGIDFSIESTNSCRAIEQDVCTALLYLWHISNGKGITTSKELAAHARINNVKRVTAALKNLARTRFILEKEGASFSFTIINLEEQGKTRDKKYIYTFATIIEEQIKGNHYAMDINSYFQIPQGLPRRLWEFLQNKQRKGMTEFSFKWKTWFQWLPILDKDASGRKRTLRNTLQILQNLGYLTFQEKKTKCEIFLCEAPDSLKKPQEITTPTPIIETESEQKCTEVIFQENIQLKEKLAEMSKKIDELNKVLQMLMKDKQSVVSEEKILSHENDVSIEQVTTSEEKMYVSQNDAPATNLTFDYKKAIYREKVNQLISEVPKYNIEEIDNWLKQNNPSIKISTILRYHNNNKEKLIQKFPHILLTINHKKQKESIGPGLVTNFFKELADFSPSEKELNQIFVNREKTQQKENRKKHKEQTKKIKEAETIAEEEAKKQQKVLLEVYKQNKENISFSPLIQKAEERTNQHQLVKTIPIGKQKKYNSIRDSLMRTYFMEELSSLLGYKGVYVDRKTSTEIFNYAQKKANEVLCSY